MCVYLLIYNICIYVWLNYFSILISSQIILTYTYKKNAYFNIVKNWYFKVCQRSDRNQGLLCSTTSLKTTGQNDLSAAPAPSDAVPKTLGSYRDTQERCWLEMPHPSNALRVCVLQEHSLSPSVLRTLSSMLALVLCVTDSVKQGRLCCMPCEGARPGLLPLTCLLTTVSLSILRGETCVPMTNGYWNDPLHQTTKSLCSYQSV